MRLTLVLAVTSILAACVTTDAGRGSAPAAGRLEASDPQVQNTLARLRDLAQRQNSAGGRPSVAPPLTQGELRALAEQVSQCWSVDASMLSLQDVVELRVQLDGQGNVRNVVPGDRGIPNDARSRAVYESARLALLSPRCNPLRVPTDKMQSVMAAIFRFSPSGLVQ